MTPKITIITINFNNFQGLKTTFESVKNQTFQDFEYIVIDGGSSDGSLKLLKEHTNYIDYWVSEPDKGVYHAMNKGILKATGEYLLFLNSGDHFYSNVALQESLDHLTEEDIIYFNLQVTEEDKSFIKSYPKILSFSYFVEDTLPHPATFIKRVAFLKTNIYKEDFKILSDWKFFIDAICKYNLTYKKIDKPLSTFYIGGMSSNPANRALKHSERSQVLEQEYAAFMKDMSDTLLYKHIIENFRKSRIIKILVKFGFLNKF
ncbi:glycosyltransferase family 2 protein [Mariniflexile gromovii]|uniref:Glycosyltransferase n=1 Tax=Mariniflexile gromovii TaxID=362523 RepID=A0ABS4BVC2_9FLAO|nr:glycosyltransferase family 2 protein [Mariniflexile gromovii]MBP0904521.1 glycosyltransferase [Mariniflexile gromovii]